MSAFFVTDELFTIDVFSFEYKGEVEFEIDPAKVPADVEPEKLSFTFKQLSYKDSVDIKSSCLTIDMDGNSKVELYKLQDQLFRKLLVKWNIETVVNSENIDKLNPIVAQIIGDELMKRVKIS